MTAQPEDPHIGLVVEGRGDERAIPVLLRRYLHSRGEYRELLGKPVTCHGRQKATREGGLEGFVAIAASRPGCRAVLVFLDGDGDPVCHLGPTLHHRSVDSGAAHGKPVTICLADTCFEAWIYASAETLELGDIEYDPASNPTSSIKEGIKPSSYVKPTWQPRLVDRMDLELATERNVGLQRLFARVDQLLPLFEVA